MSVSWWIDIENASGTRQGPGPLLATRWRSTAVLSRAGTFEFEIPATDTRAADLLQPKRVARCRAVINGATVEVGAGIIETITIRIANGVPMRVVSGPDLLGELRRALVDKRVIAAMLAYYYLPTFVNDDEIPYKLLADYANAKTPSAWTLADATGSTIGSGVAVTDTEVYARFRDDTVLNALIRVAEVTGEHFRIGTGRQVQWIGRTADFTASGVRAVMGGDGNAIVDGGYTYLAQIASISHVEDVQGLVNRVIIYGSGEGDSRLTIRGATEWPDGTAISGSPHFRTIGGRNYYLVQGSTSSSAVDGTFNCLEDSTSSTAYGVHEQALQINNIAPVSNTAGDVENAANQLVRAAWEYLQENSEPRNSYSLRLVGCNTVLRPGTTIPVIAQRWVDGKQPIDIRELLNILSATIELDANGLRTSDVVVSDGSRQPMGTGDVIAAQAAKSYVSQAHPQMGPNVDTISFQSDFDDTISASLPFWFGNETTQVQQLLFRFKIDPLRSTVKTVAGSASVSVSVEVPINGVAVPSDNPLARIVYYEPDNDRFTAALGAGTSGPISDADATVDLSTAITTTYGIFEDSGSTVADNTTVSLFLNGNAISGGSISSLGSGWFQVDLTTLSPAPIDLDTGQPASASNVVTCIGAVGKRGRITAQLQIRSTIQSVAYST